MPECDGIFDLYNIPFQSEFEDEAVHMVWREFYGDPHYAKFLILCWFDVTYGRLEERRYNVENSRSKMSAYLRRSRFSTFEELFASTEDPTSERNN